LLVIWRPRGFTLFPYTTLFRSGRGLERGQCEFLTAFGRGLVVDEVGRDAVPEEAEERKRCFASHALGSQVDPEERQGVLERFDRSEEHTSELQSRENLVCRLLL